MALVARSDSPNALVNKVDQVKAFHLYAFFGGDAEKTARTCGVETRIIESLAHDFNWPAQIKGQHRLDTDEGRKIEQDINRARNYVMAQRIASIIEHITLKAAEDPEKWAEINCVDIDPETDQKIFSSKPLVEIAKAAQIVQDMTYRALGDKVAGNATTTLTGDDKVTHLMVNVYQGLGKLNTAMKQVARVVEEPIELHVNAAVNAKAK